MNSLKSRLTLLIFLSPPVFSIMSYSINYCWVEISKTTFTETYWKVCINWHCTQRFSFLFNLKIKKKKEQVSICFLWGQKTEQSHLADCSSFTIYEINHNPATVNHFRCHNNGLHNWSPHTNSTMAKMMAPDQIRKGFSEIHSDPEVVSNSCGPTLDTIFWRITKMRKLSEHNSDLTSVLNYFPRS